MKNRTKLFIQTRRMFLQLTLALVLLALPGSLQQIDGNTVSQRRDVRLRGGTEYAGRVEVYWSEYSGTSYKWWSVCTDMWGIDEARAVCQKLNYTNSKVIGLLQCERESCFGQRPDDKVTLSCTRMQPCTLESTEIYSCNNKQQAIVTCDFTLTEEVNSSTTALSPIITQEPSECENKEARATESCGAVGGVLGAVIIAMVIVLVVMNLGWAWIYYRRYVKQKEKGEIDIPNEAQISNPTYDIPPYDTKSPTENHTSSARDNQTQPFGHTHSPAGMYHTTEQNHRKNHHLEGSTSMAENNDNIYHTVKEKQEEQDQNYAMINEGMCYEIPLKTKPPPP